MAVCPNCFRDRFIKRHYTTQFSPRKIKVYWACLACGFTEEGYYTTPEEMAEVAQREAEGTEDLDSTQGD